MNKLGYNYDNKMSGSAYAVNRVTDGPEGETQKNPINMTI